jgi:hypothetical protein
VCIRGERGSVPITQLQRKGVGATGQTSQMLKRAGGTAPGSSSYNRPYTWSHPAPGPGFPASSYTPAPSLLCRGKGFSSPRTEMIAAAAR